MENSEAEQKRAGRIINHVSNLGESVTPSKVITFIPQFQMKKREKGGQKLI